MVELQHAIYSVLKDCLKLKNHEKILILADDLQSELAYNFYLKAKCISKSTSLLTLPAIKKYCFEPPVSSNQFLKNLDIIIITTNKSISHTKSRRKATKAGTRIASLPGVTKDILKRNLTGNYKKLITKSRKISDILTIGRKAHLTTSIGTDLHFSISRKKGYPETGMIHEPGDFSNLPAGEACIAPVEGSTQGTLIIDGSFPGIGLVKTPIKMSIKDGYAVRITGGEEVKKIRKLLHPFGRESRNIAEIGIGTNPNAILSGITLEDEKVLGNIHIGLGNNISFGGKINIPCHFDGVMLKPTFTIDGKIILEQGKLMV